MEKLRSDDFMYSYWLGPGGITFWLIERQNELFLQSITPRGGWLAEHFSKRDDGGAQVDAITQTIRLFGLTPFPVYSDYKFMSDADKKRLNAQFVIYEAEMERATQEREKADQEEEPEVSSESPDQEKPDLKLVRNDDQDDPTGTIQ